MSRSATLRPMLPNGRRLGAHLPLGHGMVKAADRAAEIGASALQVFSDNPTSWRRRPRPTAGAAGVPGASRRSRHRAARDPRALPRQPRGTGPRDAPALGGRPGQRAPSRRAVRRAVRQRAHRVAPGRRSRGRDRAPRRGASGSVVDAVGGAAPGVVLVLENGAGGGFGLGSSIEELGAIDAGRWARPGSTARALRLLPRHGAPLGRGLRRSTRRRAWTRPSTAFDDAVGLDRLQMVHLNDSRAELGSRADRHEHVGAGRIGGGGSRRAWSTHPALDHVVVLPRDAGHGGRLRRGQHRAASRTWRTGGRSADLPPAAFHTRELQGPQRPGRRRRRGDDAPSATGGPAERRLDDSRARPAPRARRPARDPRPRRPHAPARPRRPRPLGRRPGARHAGPARLAVDGEVPLLGPTTSIGTFHHGAVYYYLLAPAAIDLRRPIPVVVTGEIALFGIAAVAGTWWLARLVGGPLAAAAAGLLAAVSPPGIDESTFIWNPNLIPAASALAFAGALMARRTGRAALVAGERRRGDGHDAVPRAGRGRRGAAGVGVGLGPGPAPAGRTAHRRAWLRGGLGAVAIIAAGYVPLLVHELGDGLRRDPRASSTTSRAAGARPPAGSWTGSSIVGLRSITWPLTGLITDRLVVSLIAAMIVTALGVIAVVGRRRRRPRGGAGCGRGPIDLPAVRWLAAVAGVSIAGARGVRAEPRGHRPGAAQRPLPRVPGPARAGARGRRARPPRGLRARRRCEAPAAPRTSGARSHAPRRAWPPGSLTVILAGIAVTAWPPAVSPDGGWPLVDAAAVACWR